MSKHYVRATVSNPQHFKDLLEGFDKRLGNNGLELPPVFVSMNGPKEYYVSVVLDIGTPGMTYELKHVADQEMVDWLENESPYIVVHGSADLK